MAKEKYLLRYHAIINKLKNAKKASFDQILYHLENDAQLSDFQDNYSLRTFQRDKNEIADLFGIEIKFDKAENAYYIANAEEDKGKLRLLEAFDVFTTFNKYQALEGVLFPESRKASGSNHLHGFIHAIQNRKQVQFTYQPFWSDKGTTRIAEPYALKEYRGRWYLLCAETKNNSKVKTFGLDRISEMEILTAIFQFPSNLNVNKLFENSFGIYYETDSEPETIVISFSPEQGKYVKSFPLHHSQKELVASEQEYRIEIEVFPTFDLEMEILSYGEMAEVISPKSFKKRIAERLKSAVSIYKKAK
jgi:predicted DNA-binding transcriptional regulator YafY